MSLDLAGETQRIQSGLRRGDGFEQTQARDRGSSAASESRPNREFAADFESKTGRTHAGPLPREPEGTCDAVVVGYGTVDEVEVQGVRRRLDPLDDADTEVESNGHRERVEGRSEVADRARYDNRVVGVSRDLARRHRDHRLSFARWHRISDLEGPGARDSGLGTRGSGLGTRGLGARGPAKGGRHGCSVRL